MEQILKVLSDEWDADENGSSWFVRYVLYKNQDDDYEGCFDLYTDDGAGNGEHVARGYKKQSMISLTLRLGTFVEWGTK